MADKLPQDAGLAERREEDENLLPLEDDDASVLSAESTQAINVLKAEITRFEQLGDAGWRPLRVLLDALGEAVFSTAERVITTRQEETEQVVPAALVLFAKRNVEVIVRRFTESAKTDALSDDSLLSSAVRYILREADEALVIAHGLAAQDVKQKGSTVELRGRGQRVFLECRLIADERGFGARLENLSENA